MSARLGRWQPYPEYTDSGIEWLGKIPAHWEICQLRRKLRDGTDGIKIGPFGSSLKREFMVEIGYKVYGQENIIYNNFTTGRNYVDEDKFRELEQYRVYPGDLLITMMGSSGRCRVVPPNVETGIMDSHLLRLRMRDQEIDPHFAEIVLDQANYVEEQLNALGKGAIMQGLNSSIVKSIVLGIPLLSEQRAIADFLDRETAKIDALIAKKQRLIELLHEQRAVLISQAVTKGLDPSVPMSDSGIEWLGEIPSHWEVIKIKHLCSVVKDGLHQTPPKVEEGIPFVSTQHVRNRRIAIENATYISDEDYRAGHPRTAPQANDVLITLVGSIGFSAILTPEFIPISFTRHVGYVRPTSRVLPGYLVNYFESNSFKTFIALETSQVAQPSIYLARLAEHVVPTPPIQEQERIVSHLAEKLASLNLAVEKIEIVLQKFQEYRTALISAAVTGKIDVRGEIKTNRRTIRVTSVEKEK